jgi:hypothetical protein
VHRCLEPGPGKPDLVNLVLVRSLDHPLLTSGRPDVTHTVCAGIYHEVLKIIATLGVKRYFYSLWWGLKNLT